MPEKNAGESSKTVRKEFNARHLGRGAQTWIYLGKLLRMFIYQNDWKVLPMSAMIAGLVGLVIRRMIFLNMEGTIMGSFAMVCVCIWNGSFNSIQVICRERDVIKREHRSGMHISAYIAAHMIYQLLICILQTGITLYVTHLTGVKYPSEGMFTPWMMVDLGITMVLITYASDMLSLWISAIAHTSTTAMTIMPFVLIVQLVFSGVLLNIPAWAQPIKNVTISSPGLKCVAAQADTNHLPFVTISEILGKMHDNEVEFDLTLQKGLKILSAVDDENVKEAVKVLQESPEVQEFEGEGIKLRTTVGTILEAAGEKEVKAYLEERAAAASYKPEYEHTKENVAAYWRKLILFIVVFAFLAMITLEFIDKDKR